MDKMLKLFKILKEYIQVDNQKNLINSNGTEIQ